MNNTDFFNNKVVVITGSSKGIGKALALKMGQYQAKVVLNGRHAESLRQTEEELRRTGINCFAVLADISEVQGAKKLIDETIGHFGQLDVLVNNAGIAVKGLFTETEPFVWEKVLRANTLSYIYPTSFAIPHLQFTRGSIVFVSSIGGRAGLPGHGAYSFSKMPLNSLAQTLDIELEHDQIHVGIVYVGFTRNDPRKTIFDGSGKSKILPSRAENLLMDPSIVADKIIRLVKKRQRTSVLSGIGHLQSFFYLFAPIRRMIMRKMLRSYHTMYEE